MYLAPSKNESSPKSEKHSDSHLIKLFGQLRNALIDPSTSAKTMAGIAGLAIGPKRLNAVGTPISLRDGPA